MPNSSWLIVWRRWWWFWWWKYYDERQPTCQTPHGWSSGGREPPTQVLKNQGVFQRAGGSVTFSISSINWITFFKRHLVNLVVLQILNYLCSLLPAVSSTSSECIDRNSNARIELDDNLKTPSPSVSYFAKNISISISEKLHLKCKDQGTPNGLWHILSKVKWVISFQII